MAQALPERHNRYFGDLAAAALPQPNDKHRRNDTLKSFSTLKEDLFPVCASTLIFKKLQVFG